MTDNNKGWFNTAKDWSAGQRTNKDVPTTVVMPIEVATPAQKKEEFKYCVFLDAGHGGVNPKGEYTTAPSKQWKHVSGEFHQGTMFLEGVKNREYCDLIAKGLEERGVNVVKVYHPFEDVSLTLRVKKANEYHKNIQKGIYFSEHSNATPQHTARGFSVWTSVGQTTSDILAQKFVDLFKEKLKGDVSRIMEDNADGDSDYEANFYVLRETLMPAVLSENLFFDQINDACILMSSVYRDKYVKVTVEWIIWCLKYMENGK